MKKKHIYLILCFFWMAIIFWFSAQVGNDSQGMSNHIIQWMDQIFHVNIMNDEGWLFDIANFIIRKGAHMSEYAILAVLFALYFKECGLKKYYIYVVLGVFLYAMSDEIHQLFVVGRSGQFRDVIIDTIGGMIGLTAHYLICKTYFFMRKKGNCVKS